jgi:Methylase involved in ubiquinone/menaquinone biosynthesis
MSWKVALVRLIYWFRGFSEDPVKLFKAIGVESDDEILEIGCAVGFHTLALADLAVDGKVHAVDIWQEGLDYLRDRTKAAGNVEVLCCSAESIELPQSSLDKIVCFDTLHEIAKPDQALRKWVGFLKTDGKLLFKDPEISPETIKTFSEGKLHREKEVNGVHVFIKK